MDVDTQFHVLAVDDSLIDRKLIERLLRTSSFQVTAVDSGTKALELLSLLSDMERGSNQDDNYHEMEVNLIITDYCMPGMTGYDLLRKIKESENLRDIPVVIMSSENISSRINRCLDEGAEEFLLKPVRLSDVDKLKPHLMRASRSKGGWMIDTSLVIRLSTMGVQIEGAKRREGVAKGSEPMWRGANGVANVVGCLWIRPVLSFSLGFAAQTDVEAETNHVDRVVAHLLFHRPLKSLVNHVDTPENEYNPSPNNQSRSKEWRKQSEALRQRKKFNK